MKQRRSKKRLDTQFDFREMFVWHRQVNTVNRNRDQSRPLHCNVSGRIIVDVACATVAVDARHVDTHLPAIALVVTR